MKNLTKNRFLFTCLLVYLLLPSFLNPVLAQQSFTVDQFMGVNWQWSNPIPPTECVGFVREFHSWSNDQNDWEHFEPVNPVTGTPTTYPNECFGFNPPNSTAIDYDFFYTDMRARGLTISPAMTNSLPHYRGYESEQDTLNFQSGIAANVGDIFRIPVKWDFGPGGWTSPSTTDATSYIDRSDWIYNFVARYGGNTAVNTDNLKHCSNEVGDIGQGQITYIESWNEPNKDGLFGDAQSDFSPEQYATMANLDFDGDDGIQDGNNTKLTGFNPATEVNYQLGINTLDPDMRYVMGGTVDIDDIWPEWIVPIRNWFISHRDDGIEFPFDVLNFHHYSTNGPDTGSDKWISPERDELRTRMANLVNLKNTAFGGTLADREVWLSEFGYDTNEQDPNGWDFVDGPGDPTAAFSVETLQALWILRSYLELAAAGVDRAIVHDINDSSSSPIAAWDNHTGLLTSGDEPKQAWFYVYTMRNLLEGFNYFDDSQSNSNFDASDANAGSGRTRVYEFRNEEGQSVWAVWSPTNSGVERDVTITLSGNQNGATGFRPSEPSIHGLLQPLEVINGQITVTATETPIFIIEENREAPVCPNNITTANITCNSVDITFDIPAGQQYENYQLWFGPASIIADINQPNFAALTGDGMRFQQDISGELSYLTISELDPLTDYIIYLIPENENGIPLDAQGNIQYCIIEASTIGNEPICHIDISDQSLVANVISNISTPGFMNGLFDEQNLASDFCQNTDPIPTSTPWVNFGGQAVMEIEFLQELYIIDQIYYFDGNSAGVFLVEGSIDRTNWIELTNFYTNGQNEWRTENNFFPFNSGVRYLRLTALSQRAEITEMFICGHPVCSFPPPEVSLRCNTVDFVTCEESSFFNSLEIQGNSQIETHNGINSSSVNYPTLILGEAGPNQLIPGVTYTPDLETCSGSNCSTETLSFTVPNTGECVLDNAPVRPTSRYSGGCGTYTFIVDANPGDQVQVWLSHSQAFDNSLTTHPLEQNPESEMMILTVEETGIFGAPQTVITVPYDRCERRFFLAYRYFTESESSPLYTLTLANVGINIAWQLVCTCSSGSPNTPTPNFIIDNCYITDIVYDYLEVGERLQNKEYAAPSFGTQQLLKSEVHNITNSEYTYHLSYATTAESLRFKVKDTDPWTSLDLTAVPCLTTNDPPSGGSEREDTRAADLKVSTSLRLYPNPTQDYLNVEITESANLLLIGVDGKSHDLRDLKTTSFGYQFSTIHLTPGLYLLRTIDQNGKVKTGKFFVSE